jgi:hypothetical protein
MGIPGLVNVDKTMERSTIFNRKIHYFYGKSTINYGKTPFSMGKLTISMVIFNSYVTNYQRVYHGIMAVGFW